VDSSGVEEGGTDSLASGGGAGGWRCIESNLMIDWSDPDEGAGIDEGAL
jgi:hypothetical protein